MIRHSFLSARSFLGLSLAIVPAFLLGFSPDLTRASWVPSFTTLRGSLGYFLYLAVPGCWLEQLLTKPGVYLTFQNLEIGSTHFSAGYQMCWMADLTTGCKAKVNGAAEDRSQQVVGGAPIAACQISRPSWPPLAWQMVPVGGGVRCSDAVGWAQVKRFMRPHSAGL